MNTSETVWIVDDDKSIRWVLEKTLEAPIYKGDVVGKLFYQVDGEDIAEYPLLALNDVEEGGIFSRLIDYIVLMFKGWLS